MARKTKNDANGTAHETLRIAAEAGSPELAEEGVEALHQDDAPIDDAESTSDVAMVIVQGPDGIFRRADEQAEPAPAVTTLDDGSEVTFSSSSPPIGDHIVISEGVKSTPMPEPDPLQDAIYDLNEQAFVLKEEWDALAKKTKAKKGEWEETMGEIQRLIRASRESLPLFPDKRTAKPKPEPFEAAVVDADAEEAASEEDWKSILCDRLTAYGLPKKIVKTLAEGDVFTIGDISALGDNRKSLTDVKNIGDAAADKINAALDLLWQARADAAAKAEDAREANEDMQIDEPLDDDELDEDAEPFEDRPQLHEPDDEDEREETRLDDEADDDGEHDRPRD